MIAEPLRPLARPIGELRLLDGNPRRGDVESVKRSLKRFGQRKPVVVRADGTVEAGNTTLKAALELGWPEIACVAFGDDDATAKAFALADNRTSELGSFDLAALTAMAVEVHAADPELLEAASYSEADLNALLAGQRVPEKRTDPDAVPDAPAEPVTVPGDVWELGPHRLLCGDATRADVVNSVMAGDLADLVWTDPPYGVDYTAKNAMLNAQDGGNRLETGISSDELGGEALDAFLRLSLGNALAVSHPGASWWVAAPCLAQPLRAYADVLCDLGVWRHTLVWVKDGFVLGRADYHGRHEQLLYGWAPGAPHRPPPTHSEDSVWEIPRPRKNDLHPTMKPVALVARAIGNHTSPGAIVLDVFGGSGTTLIAAHGLNRVARLVELEPGNCDVICRRYQEHAGTKPVLQSTGQPHDFTA